MGRPRNINAAEQKLLDELQSPMLVQAVEALKAKLEWFDTELEMTRAQFIEEMNRACPSCGETRVAEDRSYMLGTIRVHKVK